MFEEKFRIWNGDRFEDVGDIHFGIGPIYSGVAGRSSSWHDLKFLQRYTGLKDKNKKEIWQGDLRQYHGKFYKVVNEIWRFTLERNLVEFGENETIVIDEDVAYESIFFGTIYENPELLNAK